MTAMYRCVVVATDGSPTAEVALLHAVGVAEACDARLHIVNARRSGGPMMAASLETAAMVGHGVEAAVDAQASLASVLEERADELRGRGLDVAVHCGVGEPADVIVHHAEKLGADLIVVGNKGMHRRVLGSIPKAVSHRAPCSVLIVRTTIL